MIDCGTDWLNRVHTIGPMAIVLTHAHADHAAGLAGGAPCPVYATRESLNLLSRYPIKDWHLISPKKPETIGGVIFETFPVQHSIRAPAVGYRVLDGSISFFYLPDVAILNPTEALREVSIYIGDGATVRHAMVRRSGGELIGHASIVAQLVWCRDAAVRLAVFTHCGSQVVRGPARKLDLLVKRLGEEHGVEASLASDGDVVRLSSGSLMKLRR